MPELPEVETIVNALRPHVLSKKILGVKLLTEQMRSPLPPDIHALLSGRTITGIFRRGKYILVELDGKIGMVLHLGMTGAFKIKSKTAPPDKHDRIIFDLNDGKSWRFEDIRKFGEVVLTEGDKLPESVAKLGPEPFSDEFTGDYLKKKSSERKIPVKNFILEQRVVAGIGNIYASEALFLAGIRPQTPAGKISVQRYRLLAEKIKEVLQKAIVAGGTTISDYKSVDGSEGKFALQLMVYGREGELCKKCEKGKINKIILGGRSSFYCPVCQK